MRMGPPAESWARLWSAFRTSRGSEFVWPLSCERAVTKSLREIVTNGETSGEFLSVRLLCEQGRNEISNRKHADHIAGVSDHDEVAEPSFDHGPDGLGYVPRSRGADRVGGHVVGDGGGCEIDAVGHRPDHIALG